MSDATATQTFDEIDRALLAEIQQRFPIDHRPFEVLGQKLDINEQECLKRIERLRSQGAIQRIGAMLDIRVLGYQQMLVAMRVDPANADMASESLREHPGVSYTCRRNDPFNVWFTVFVPPNDSLEQVINILRTLARADETILLPMVRRYQRAGRPDRPGVSDFGEPPQEDAGQPGAVRPSLQLREEDLRLIRVLQDDLPLIEMPFAVLAEQAGVTEDELFEWMRNAQHQGSIRRFAAVVPERRPEALASALVVWQVPQEAVDEIGERMARFREVIRCEQRPVYPKWPYALFTTIQAQTPSGCMEVVKRIEQEAGQFPHKHLYHLSEYRRAQLTYFSSELEVWWQRVGLPTMKTLP